MKTKRKQGEGESNVGKKSSKPDKSGRSPVDLYHQ